MLVAPVFHTYVPPPLAVSVAVCPEQMVELFAAATGEGAAMTDVVAVLVHPMASLTTTVYVVLAVGETEMLDVVCPLLQE